jgi:UDP-N-acetylglucosamine transferase subunit ALG13
MILVTVGTNEQRFDRLVRAVAELRVDEPLVVQYGASRVPHGMGRWIEFVPFDELAELASEARVVVCHAGVGSIMLAHRSSKRPIVMARRHDLDEAVDNHQLPLARRLHAAGVVTLVDDAVELAAAVAKAAAPAPADVVALPGASVLAADLRGFLADAQVRTVAPLCRAS